MPSLNSTSRAASPGGWGAMLGAGGAGSTGGIPLAPLDVRLMNHATRWTILMAGLTFLALAVTVTLRQGGFSFERIVLEAEPHRTSVATVRANALPRLEGNFFTVDLHSARLAFEAVPWVQRAEVQRHWPGQLRVRLQEHTAVALWEPVDQRERRDDRLVGQDGSVFRPTRATSKTINCRPSAARRAARPRCGPCSGRLQRCSRQWAVWPVAASGPTSAPSNSAARDPGRLNSTPAPGWNWDAARQPKCSPGRNPLCAPCHRRWRLSVDRCSMPTCDMRRAMPCAWRASAPPPLHHSGPRRW